MEKLSREFSKSLEIAGKCNKEPERSPSSSLEQMHNYYHTQEKSGSFRYPTHRRRRNSLVNKKMRRLEDRRRGIYDKLLQSNDIPKNSGKSHLRKLDRARKSHQHRSHNHHHPRVRQRKIHPKTGNLTESLELRSSINRLSSSLQSMHVTNSV